MNIVISLGPSGVFSVFTLDVRRKFPLPPARRMGLIQIGYRSSLSKLVCRASAMRGMFSSHRTEDADGQILRMFIR